MSDLAYTLTVDEIIRRAETTGLIMNQESAREWMADPVNQKGIEDAIHWYIQRCLRSLVVGV